jgi:hypothetical protein
MNGQPRFGTTVVTLPREVVDEKLPGRAKQAAECGGDAIEARVVKRHHRADGIELADRAHVLHTFWNEPRVRTRPRIDAYGIKAACAQTLNQSTVAAADVQDTRVRSNAFNNRRVEPTPPPIFGHGDIFLEPGSPRRASVPE